MERTERDDALLEMILAAEGGTYTNDPHDAGGPTRWGITLLELAAWRKRETSSREVEALSRAEAEAIYRARYLVPFATLPEELRSTVTDMGVNAGVRRATILLQQLTGTVVDGAVGLRTLAASKTRDWCEPYTFMRIAYYEALIERRPTQAQWRMGWRARALRFLTPTKTGAASGRELVGIWMGGRAGKAYDD